MKPSERKNPKRHEQPRARLGRRDVMKLGAGAVMAGVLEAQAAWAQGQDAPTMTGGGQPATPTGGLQPVGGMVQNFPKIQEAKEVNASVDVGYITATGPGWVNNSGRASGNGPMDVCSQRIVEWVHGFSEKDIDAKTLDTLNYLLCDTVSSIYGGFESEPARINARISQKMQSDMKCTVFGYGIVTSPEMAAFTNGAMIRHAELNTHMDEMFAGPIAIGEALHSTGAQVQAALCIAYEVIAAIGGTGLGNYDPGGFDAPYHSVGVAMACGKLMGLNQDQLANAVSLALVPHMPMYVCHIGTQSMWKGTHSSEQVRNGVWAAILASEGMTGPNMPFEARDGLFAHIGAPTRDLRFPASTDGRLAIETSHGGGKGHKWVPTEGTTHTFHLTIAPEVLKWAKAEEIESIKIDFAQFQWHETGDPPKWDPRNRETADHSMAYNVARHLLDGDIYFDSFTKEKYLDAKARELMNKITITPTTDPGVPDTTLHVRKKSGEEKTFPGGRQKTMTADDLIARYHRAANFRKVEPARAGQILHTWMNLKDVEDIGEAVKSLTNFVSFTPLSDKTPARIS